MRRVAFLFASAAVVIFGVAPGLAASGGSHSNPREERQAVAEAPGGALFAGAADGGVWKSSDAGQHWTPVFDMQDTLSIGALLVTSSGGGYTVYAGTGEANTSSDSYGGIGVLASNDGGSSWNRVGGDELNGALIFRLVQNRMTLLAATSHGLYSFN